MSSIMHGCYLYKKDTSCMSLDFKVPDQVPAGEGGARDVQGVLALTSTRPAGFVCELG